MRGMRGLITGCAGFIGSHLVESMLAEGDEIVGVDCFNDNYGRPQKLKNLEQAQQWEDFDFVPIDLSRGDLESLVADCEIVFHLAAEPGVRKSWGARFEAYVRNNIVATQHLLEAMRAHPGRRLVLASSSSVYGQAECLPTSESARPTPISPYGATKLHSEQLADLYRLNFGLELITLRYFSVYGPRQRPDMAFSIFLNNVLDGRPLELFGGDQTRDFTYVDDVVAATRKASLVEVGGAFNIGGGSRVSMSHVLQLMEEITGRPAEVRRTAPQTGDVRDTGADISAASRALGYSPSVPLEDGLAAQWDWTVRSGSPMAG
jgi:nucleoside-diphosphate-sugar epimerase